MVLPILILFASEVIVTLPIAAQKYFYTPFLFYSSQSHATPPCINYLTSGYSIFNL